MFFFSLVFLLVYSNMSSLSKRNELLFYFVLAMKFIHREREEATKRIEKKSKEKKKLFSLPPMQWWREGDGCTRQD